MGIHDGMSARHSQVAAFTVISIRAPKPASRPRSSGPDFSHVEVIPCAAPPISFSSFCFTPSRNRSRFWKVPDRSKFPMASGSGLHLEEGPHPHGHHLELGLALGAVDLR